MKYQINSESADQIIAIKKYNAWTLLKSAG